MSTYLQFQRLFDSLQKEWDTTKDRKELLAIMWLFQSTLQDYIEQGKEELREKGKGRYETPFGEFSVSEPKTDYLVLEDSQLSQRLGHYFQLLFQTNVRTHPKFEEVFPQLPTEMKSVVLTALQQKTRKARVSFKKRGEK
jgi:hypothetical protein